MDDDDLERRTSEALDRLTAVAQEKEALAYREDVAMALRCLERRALKVMCLESENARLRELVAALDDLLAIYRLGLPRGRGGPRAERVARARAALSGND